MTGRLVDTPRAGKYRVIYADPPWTFETHSGKGKDRSPEKHYDCMDLEAICRLPVPQVAAANSWLFLWTTWPHLFQAADVMRCWGFRYSGTGFVWAKLRPGASVEQIEPKDWDLGLGYTTRKNTEPCLVGFNGDLDTEIALLGRRGKPTRVSKAVRELVVSPRREHSRKPDEVRDRICQFASGPYLEMFSRSEDPRFDSWGKESGKFNQAG